MTPKELRAICDACHYKGVYKKDIPICTVCRCKLSLKTIAGALGFSPCPKRK